MSAAKKTGGLAGIVAGESSISTVGLGSGLNYRGYNVGIYFFILLLDELAK
jgi:hypothetical protein